MFEKVALAPNFGHFASNFLLPNPEFDGWPTYCLATIDGGLPPSISVPGAPPNSIVDPDTMAVDIRWQYIEKKILIKVYFVKCYDLIVLISLLSSLNHSHIPILDILKLSFDLFVQFQDNETGSQLLVIRYCSLKL